MTVYEQLHAACRPLIDHFVDDLEKHDRESLEKWPGVPFLHWTCDSNTNLVFLPPADYPGAYPTYGERVPYLFGTATRDHILREKRTFAEYFLRPANSPHRYTCHHYDGVKLRQVTVEKALEIVKAYARPIEAAWHSEYLNNERPWEYKRLRDASMAYELA